MAKYFSTAVQCMKSMRNLTLRFSNNNQLAIKTWNRSNSNYLRPSYTCDYDPYLEGSYTFPRACRACPSVVCRLIKLRIVVYCTCFHAVHNDKSTSRIAVTRVLNSEVCGSRNLESASDRGFWTKIRDRVRSSTLYWICSQSANAMYTASFSKGYRWVDRWSIVM